MSNQIQTVASVKLNAPQYEQLYQTLSVPEPLGVNKRSNISIASTDYLHRVNMQLMQTSQTQHDAIVNNLQITNEQLKEEKQKIDLLKKQQLGVLQDIEHFNKAITEQFGDIHKNISKLTAYFKKYGLLKDGIQIQQIQQKQKADTTQQGDDKQDTDSNNIQNPQQAGDAQEQLQNQAEQLKQQEQLKQLLDF